MKAFPAVLYGYCVALAAAMCAGQILFKFASLQQTEGSFSVARMLSSPWFIAAVGLYGISTFLWVYILTRMPLSIAYPFSLLGAALVPLAAYFIFSEPVTVKMWVGLGFVLVGLYVMNAA